MTRRRRATRPLRPVRPRPARRQLLRGAEDGASGGRIDAAQVVTASVSAIALKSACTATAGIEAVGTSAKEGETDPERDQNRQRLDESVRQSEQDAGADDRQNAAVRREQRVAETAEGRLLDERPDRPRARRSWPRRPRRGPAPSGSASDPARGRGGAAGRAAISNTITPTITAAAIPAALPHERGRRSASRLRVVAAGDERARSRGRRRSRRPTARTCSSRRRRCGPASPRRRATRTRAGSGRRRATATRPGESPVSHVQPSNAVASGAGANARPAARAPSSSIGSSPTCSARSGPTPSSSSASRKIAGSGLAAPARAEVTTVVKNASTVRRAARCSGSAQSQFATTASRGRAPGGVRRVSAAPGAVREGERGDEVVDERRRLERWSPRAVRNTADAVLPECGQARGVATGVRERACSARPRARTRVRRLPRRARRRVPRARSRAAARDRSRCSSVP